jgi:coenzyme F420 hydrogenase subunit beta
MSNWEQYKKEVIDSKLYSNSGIEVGLAPEFLELKENKGDYELIKIKEGDISEDIIKFSPDKFVNYPELNKFIFGKYPDNWLFGEVKKFYLGYAKDNEVRKSGASGGILSAINIYLLENNLIDGAIVLDTKEDISYLTEPIIARNREEILKSAQSKYCVAPLNQILKNLPDNSQSFSYIGLPHEVASIRKLQQANYNLTKNINYIFGPFFGHSLYFSSIISFLKTHGVKDLNLIKKLEFRAGDWPGYLRIELKNGKVISTPKFFANYLIPFHITRESLYQVDYTNELTDVSVGDGWAKEESQQKGGWSLILARSENGLKLLNEMQNIGKLHLEEISFDDALRMHSHGIDFKKRGAFLRIENLKKKGLPYPKYGYYPIDIPISRVRFEKILATLFKICSWKISRLFIEQMPVNIMGNIFVFARKLWKKKTRGAKRGGLKEQKFIIDVDNDS